MKKKRNSSETGKLLLARRAIIALTIALRRQGIPQSQIEEMYVHAVAHSFKKSTKYFVIPTSKDSAVLGTALAIWFRDPRFVDKAGHPRALRAHGRSPSVEALLRAAGIRRNLTSAVNQLIDAKLLKPTANRRYVPSGRSAKITDFDSYLAEHIANGVLRLVETAHANFTRVGKRAPLLQRASSVRNLPSNLKAKFREYVNEQGNAFVTNIDDWLEARCVRNPQKQERAARIAHAGVYAFAYFADRPARKPKL